MSTWNVYTNASLAVVDAVLEDLGMRETSAFGEDGWADKAVHDTVVDFCGTRGEELSQTFADRMQESGYTVARFDELTNEHALLPAQLTVRG